MIDEAKTVILNMGYEGVSLDILTYLPELAHQDFTVQNQKKIGQEISERGKVSQVLTRTYKKC